MHTWPIAVAMPSWHACWIVPKLEFQHWKGVRRGCWRCCLAFQWEICLKHTEFLSVSALISLYNLSNTHILVCNVVLIFRPGLLPSSAQPPAFFGPSLAPPRCLFLYSHAHSYACSHLAVLILQTSFPFHKKKIIRQRCKLWGRFWQGRFYEREEGGWGTKAWGTKIATCIESAEYHSLVIVRRSIMTWSKL